MPKPKNVLLDNNDDKTAKTENYAKTKIVFDKQKTEKSTENKNDKNNKNTDKKQKLLSDIIGYLFDSAERNNLDNKKVNKAVKDVQYLFKKDPKQRDNRCFICEED